MLKNIIAPIQTWLLSRGQCVGCGMPLSKGTESKHSKESQKIACRCGRIYIFDVTAKNYRRALFSEI